jgi:hypothetical protein
MMMVIVSSNKNQHSTFVCKMAIIDKRLGIKGINKALKKNKSLFAIQ